MKPAKFIRVGAAAAGFLFVLVALLADQIGLGRSGSFGTGQVLLTLFGSMLIVSAVAGVRRSVSAYRAGSLILVNTLVLVAVLELLSIVAIRSRVVPSESPLSAYLAQTYYQNHEWSRQFWREASAAERYRYASFSLWRHEAFDGEFVNVDSSGTRLTPNAECSDESFDVVFVGGSAGWGWGAPDWGTIPAYLQQEIADRSNRPVCVTNLSEDGYVSTQGLIAFLRMIQGGFVPDLLISYDGVNDVQAAIETGRAGTHVSRAPIASRFEGSRHPLAVWLTSTRLYGIVSRLAGRGQSQTPARGRQGDSKLATDIVDVYVNNYRIAASLASNFGFDIAFIWQPHIVTGHKRLSAEEEEMSSRVEPAFRALFQEATLQVCRSELPRHTDMFCATEAFDDEEGQIWIDEVGHVTPRGNEVVAKLMVTLLSNKLPPNAEPLIAGELYDINSPYE